MSEPLAPGEIEARALLRLAVEASGRGGVGIERPKLIELAKRLKRLGYVSIERRPLGIVGVLVAGTEAGRARLAELEREAPRTRRRGVA